MSGLYQTSVEHLPAIGAATGFIVGSGLDMYAQQAVAAMREPLAHVWGEAFDERMPGRVRRLGRAATGSLMAIGVTVGLANGLAWQVTQPESSTVPARLEVVIDHSGATLSGNQPAAGSINEVVASLTDNEFETEALVARQGEVRIMDIHDARKDPPFGDAPLEQATQTAIDNDTQRRLQAAVDLEHSVSATVVVTNGNSIGEPARVIGEAKKGGEKVFVVNVESSAANQQVNDDLRSIAEQTGGHYWDVKAANAGGVTKEISGTISASQQKEKSKSINWVNRGLAAASTGLVALVYRRRRREPLSFKVSK